MPRRSRSSRRLWLAACVVALACRHATPVEGELAEGALPAAAFFRDPPLALVALSPDGERIAGVLNRDRAQLVFAKPVREQGLRPLGKLDEPGERVRLLGWSGAATLVVGFVEESERESRSGSPHLRIVTVPVEKWRSQRKGDGWPLPTRPGAADVVLDWLPDDPKHILVDVWQSDEEGASVRRANVEDGVRSVVVPSQPWVRHWFADHDGRVRAGHGYDPEAAIEVDYARASVDAPFERLADVERVLASEVEFAGFSLDPKIVYVRSRTENGRFGLFEYDLATRQTARRVYAEPDADVVALEFSPTDGRLWAVEMEGERPRLHFVDEQGRREQEAIDAVFSGTTNRIVSASRDGATAIVRVSGDTRPPEYYVYDRVKREMALLYASLPELAGQALAPMRPIHFTARDGVVIPGYLTLPPGAEASKLPAIVIVHDGPTERVHWDFDPTVQFLANQGFAVLQPDFRGSSGHGRDFERMGYGEWGGAMQQDIVDGARWLVSEGIADPDRIGVFGRGYGGYAALLGLATTPDLFRAGAAWGAVTDRVDLLDNPAHYGATDLNHPTAAATARDREQLAARSPALLADRIRAPVLLAHGSRDPLVDVAQMKRMQDSLEAAGRPVEALSYRGDGHDPADEQERIDFHEKLARFFARNLRVRVPL